VSANEDPRQSELGIAIAFDQLQLSAEQTGARSPFDSAAGLAA
jgi:hypothetical protein